MLRASDGDGWVLVAGSVEGHAELVHAGARALPPAAPVVFGSAMKWLITAVVLSVVDQDLMALTDTPQRWLGDSWGAGARDARRNVTLAMLLGMTSGLPSVSTRPDASCDWLSCGQGPDAFTAVDSLAPLECCVRAWASSDPSRFGSAPPGSVVNYNSMNIMIAAAMAERASGASLEQLFSLTVQRRLAAAARFVGTPPPVLDLLMSPLDYAAFIRAVLVPREREGLLSARLQSAMFAPTTAHLNGTLEAYTGAAGWQYGLGVWLEDGGEVASCIGYYGAYPRANLSSGSFAVLVPTHDLLRNDTAVRGGLLMRRAVEVMGAIWEPLQRALAESETDAASAPSPVPAAAFSADFDECGDSETVADSDAAAVALQAQRALLDRTGVACRHLLAARVRIHVTVHDTFRAFVRSKPASVACSNHTAAVHVHVFVDTLLADVPPSPPFTSSAAFIAGAASSPRLWLKLKRVVNVTAAVGTEAKRLECLAAGALDVAADQNAAIAAHALSAAAAARFAFAPDNDIGADGVAGPAWLAAPSVELRRNGSRTLVRGPSLSIALDGQPAAAGNTLVKVLSPAAMRSLSALLQP